MTLWRIGAMRMAVITTIERANHAFPEATRFAYSGGTNAMFSLCPTIHAMSECFDGILRSCSCKGMRQWVLAMKM